MARSTNRTRRSGRFPVRVTGDSMDTDSRLREDQTKVPDEDIAFLASQVRTIFMFRHNFGYSCPSIPHHFNWAGLPMDMYSATPPAVSLLVLISDPKVGHPRDQLRIEAILARASRFVDPIILYLNKGQIDFALRGSKLIQSVAGRVFKFYTPHGMWGYDVKEQEDETRRDDGSIQLYLAPDIAIGNGHVDRSMIPSRDRYKQARIESLRTANARHKERFHARACPRDWTRKPSPLRASIRADEIEHPTGDDKDDKEPNIVRQEHPKHHIAGSYSGTHTVFSAPSFADQYCSFPTPTIRGKKGLRGTWRRFTIWKSQFSEPLKTRKKKALSVDFVKGVINDGIAAISSTSSAHHF